MKKYLLIFLFALILFPWDFLSVDASYAASQFVDVPQTHLYSSSIEAWDRKDFLLKEENFNPDVPINRAEFTKILFSGVELTAESLSSCFPDVTEEWFAPYICTAKSLGIVTGYEDGLFHPEETINIAEASTMLSRALSRELDLSESENWYEPYVKSMDGIDAIPTTITSFDQALTRAEAVRFLSCSLCVIRGGGERTTYEEIQAFTSKSAKIIEQSRGPGSTFSYLLTSNRFEYLPVYQATLSPSNKFVALITKGEAGEVGVEVQNTQTGKKTFTQNLGENDSFYLKSLELFWSPDEKNLAFTLIKSPWETNEDGSMAGSVQFFSLDLTTQILTNTTINAAEYSCGKGGCAMPSGLSWSANSEKILFTTQFTNSQTEGEDKYYKFVVLNKEGKVLDEFEKYTPYYISASGWDERGELFYEQHEAMVYYALYTLSFYDSLESEAYTVGLYGQNESCLWSGVEGPNENINCVYELIYKSTQEILHSGRLNGAFLEWYNDQAVVTYEISGDSMAYSSAFYVYDLQTGETSELWRNQLIRYDFDPPLSLLSFQDEQYLFDTTDGETLTIYKVMSPEFLSLNNYKNGSPAIVYENLQKMDQIPLLGKVTLQDDYKGMYFQMETKNYEFDGEKIMER